MIKGYGKIETLRQRSQLMGRQLVIQEKVDGCFAGNTVVHLADGSKKPIRDIVKEKYDGYVCSFDFETGEYGYSRVTNWFKYPASHKRMVRVRVEGHGKSSKSSITCTEDHLVYTREGWVEAAKLKTGDEVQICYRSLDCSLGHTEMFGDTHGSELKPVFKKVLDVVYVESQTQYDIETDHHNYLVSANGILVHNSQFVFGINEETGRFHAQTRRRNTLTADDGHMGLAVANLQIQEERLNPNWVYFGECLTKRKHNRIAYGRMPKGSLVLFDIFDVELDSYLPRHKLEEEAVLLGIEVVPELFVGPFSEMPKFKELLDRESFLGDHNIEGVVIKDYPGKTFFKVVSQEFQEISQQKRVRTPKDSDKYLDDLFDAYRTESRWHKAVQHLRDEGKLDGTMRDIGPLLMELSSDFEDECRLILQEQLYNLFRKRAIKKVAQGFAEWYRTQLGQDPASLDRDE